jgi:hypothetical protein
MTFIFDVTISSQAQNVGIPTMAFGSPRPIHLTSDVWCLPPLDLLWRKQCLYVRHWIIPNRQVMMQVKCTLEIGCFSFPKDCCFLFWCGTNRANSNRNTARPFLEEKENFDYALLSESGSLSANVIRFRWPHHKMYRRNYISITVIHPRLDAACRNLPKFSECYYGLRWNYPMSDIHGIKG